MRIEKRKKYIDNIYVRLHTISGVSDEKIDLEKTAKHKNITKSYNKRYENREDESTYLLINPNKGVENNGMLETYEEFKEVLYWIFDDLGSEVDEFHIRRADLSINTDTAGDFDLYRKMHRAILCCLSYEYNITNTYESNNLWTQKHLNLAIKGSTIEAENYDKEEESHGSVPTTNRFELRSLQIGDDNTLKKEFAEKWCKRLDLAKMNYRSVQMKYNDNLERLYKEDLKKPKKQREYLSLNAFLMQYSDCIFSTAQMIDLVSRFDEVKNPTEKARNFKNAHAIEYISQKDLNLVIRAIKRKIKEYFKA